MKKIALGIFVFFVCIWIKFSFGNLKVYPFAISLHGVAARDEVEKEFKKVVLEREAAENKKQVAMVLFDCPVEKMEEFQVAIEEKEPFEDEREVNQAVETDLRETPVFFADLPEIEIEIPELILEERSEEVFSIDCAEEKTEEFIVSEEKTPPWEEQVTQKEAKEKPKTAVQKYVVLPQRTGERTIPQKERKEKSSVVLSSKERAGHSKVQSGPSSCRPEVSTGNWFPWPKLLAVKHIEGINEQNGCFPLATNYSSLAIQFAPDYCPGSFLPMVDLRGYRFDNVSYAANAGFVGRFIPFWDDCFCKILGFSAYYDWRQGCIGYFEQLGLGLEILSRRWDIRGNVYIPFGPKKHTRQCVFDDYIGDFFFIEEVIESVSYAFNAEIGYWLYYGCDFSLYLAGGPYYIAGRKCVDKTRGGEIRLRPQYQDYLALDFSFRYDDLFRAVWQAEISVYLPLYTIKNQSLRPCCLTDWQIYQPVQRFEVMPVGMRRCFQSNF